MKNSIHHLFAFLTAVLAMGCASPPARLYTLNIAAEPAGAPAQHFSVSVGPVLVPTEVDHAPITLQVAPNRVELNEFNRWAEPLDENIAQVVAGNLALQLGTTQVVAVPVADFKPDYQVTLDLQRFKSVMGKSVEVEILWLVRPIKGGQPQSGHTLVMEPVAGEGYEALVAAHSRALVKVSRAIATVIQNLAQSTPRPDQSPRHNQ
jgi:uncharacterized lipoprotein YmbA